MPVRLLLAASLSLAACTTGAMPRPTPRPRAVADAPVTRAEAAGLSRDQADALTALGVPVYVPVMPPGWTLVSATADSTVGGGSVWPEYEIAYRTDRGTCLSVIGASEGLGDVMVETPPYERDVRVAGVPMHSAARLGWGVAGERAEGWEDGRVATEWFGADVLAVRAEASRTDGCAPASPEAVETLVGSLRPLDPADDAANIGLVSFVEAGEDTAETPPGPDPEAVARDAFGTVEPGQLPAIVETLRQTGRVAVVMVTLTDAADDSVRDQRTRVVLVRRADGWHVHAAGQQVRCQSGRGHAEWSAEFCV